MELKKGIKVINTVIHECLREKMEAIVAVVDASGELISFARTDDAPLTDINLTINKAYTSARTKKTTEAFKIDLGTADEEELRFYNDPKIVTWFGGVPVFDLDGKLEGAIAITASNQEGEKRLVEKVLEAIKPIPPKESKFKLYS